MTDREHTTEVVANVAGQSTTNTLLRAEGLTCPSCVATIEKQLGRVPGVKTAKVHFASGRINVEHDAAVANVAILEEAIAKAGYKAKVAAF